MIQIDINIYWVNCDPYYGSGVFAEGPVRSIGMDHAVSWGMDQGALIHTYMYHICTLNFDLHPCMHRRCMNMMSNMERTGFTAL